MAAREATSSSASARALLQSLAVGLSVHLLYPDNPTAASFVDACDRIREVARTALDAGTVRVDVRSARFVVDDELVTGPGLDRLATACFERRVERLSFQQVPTVEELQSWYLLLSTSAEELEAREGLGVALREEGVTSIVATARTPLPDGEAASGADVDPDLLALADWIDANATGEGGLAGTGGGAAVAGLGAGGTGGTAELSATERVEALELEPGERATELYARLSTLADELTDSERAQSSFYAKAAATVRELPRSERAVFGITLFDRSASEPFAERFLSHLTDVALADLISDVAWLLGRDPAELADEVVARLGRHATVADLFRQGAARLLGPVTLDRLPELPDGSSLPDGFPDDDEENRRLALSALVDVLVHEPREEHLAGIVDRIAARLRAALAAGDPAGVGELAAALERVAELAPTELTRQLAVVWPRAIDTDAVREAFGLGGADGGPTHDATSLPDARAFASFGAHAIAPLVDVLAGRVDAARQAILLDALGQVGRGQDAIVAAALDRQEPRQAVRLAPLVSKVTGLDDVQVLEELAGRDDPELLRTIVDALRHRTPTRAAKVIVRIARSTADGSLRTYALHTLAELPDGAGRAALDELGSRGRSPLPWRARRLARRLSRRGSSGTTAGSTGGSA